MEDIWRKHAQEAEIDRLLEEEFSCDPTFGSRFLEACGLSGTGFVTQEVFVEPSLGGDGFADLLVQGEIESRKVALLIEDKITAGPALRQAQRYKAYAERMCRDGWDQVWTILVAPKAYHGERKSYDASLDLEVVWSLLQSSDQKRLDYRRGIITRALEKPKSSGVRVPDVALHRLRSEYLDCASAWCRKEAYPLQFPQLREAYDDRNSWIERVRHPQLPDHVRLRHRLWTSIRDPNGRVDLIVKPAGGAERERFETSTPPGAKYEPFSKGTGVQISFFLPRMRQELGFDSEIAEEAFQRMRDLVTWYTNDRS